MSGQQNLYTRDQAQEILSRIRSIRRTLSTGRRHKFQLMQSLTRLKDEVLGGRLHTGSSPDVSTLSLPNEQLNTASQTDITGEVS